MRTFRDLPSEITRRVEAGEHVVCVLLDAFGRRFLERYGDHPFLRRLEVHHLDTQFPSTTTAHVTTMHTGVAVEEHGLYEWQVFEPLAGRVLRPLIEPVDGMLPMPTLYERLPRLSRVFQPSRFSPSAYDAIACRGAQMCPYTDFHDALVEASSGAGGYSYVYFDGIDLTGHACGPSSREFDDAVRYALDVLEDALPQMGCTLMVTADHGQVDVDPELTLWLDELWPELPSLLTQRPAGSARDVFLHVSDVDRAIDGLRGAVGDSAEVIAGDELLALFGAPPGPRLLERLADVCVLPAPDRMAWLRSHADVQAGFRGHHGGRTGHESQTWAGFLDVAPR